MMCKRGQAASEVAVVLGLMVVFLIAFVGVLGERLVDVNEGHSKDSAEDVADVIERELRLASTAQEGYSRVLSLPESLDGRTFEVRFSNRTVTNERFPTLEVIVETRKGNYTAYRLLPSNIQGPAINITRTSMKKRDGVVHLSDVPPPPRRLVL